jgi:hypothetical protein|tara:strand:- start:4296 stop:4595 length:300 start_codon:yes stop_codon:yes gene_type:complete
MTNDKQIEILQSGDGQARIEVRLEGDTVWLNRQQLSELFRRDVKTVGKHLNNVFREGELDAGATVANFATVQKEGDRKKRDQTIRRVFFLARAALALTH